MGQKEKRKKTFPFFSADVSIKVDNKEESSISSLSVACQRELCQKLIHINGMDILNWIVSASNVHMYTLRVAFKAFY